jgi:putative hydrolase of the HAD superfamily
MLVYLRFARFVMASADWCKGIVFDAVGTLIRPDPPVAESYWRAGRRFGSRLSGDEIERRFRSAFARREADDRRMGWHASEPDERLRWQRIVAEVFDDVPADRQSDLFAALWDHFAQPGHWRLFEDVAPTLAGLAESGRTLAIASNFDARLIAIHRGHPPLAACRRIFISSQIGFRKPDRRFFDAVAASLALPAAHILLIGDDPHNDHRAAQSAGWRSLLLDRHGNHGESGTIASLSEIIEYLAD